MKTCRAKVLSSAIHSSKNGFIWVNIEYNGVERKAIVDQSSNVYKTPSIGDVGLVYCLNGDPSELRFIPQNYQEKTEAFQPAEGEVIIGNPKAGTFIKFDNQGNIMIQGNLNVQGNLIVSGTVTASEAVIGGITMTTHKHIDTQPGTGTTGVPQ